MRDPESEAFCPNHFLSTPWKNPFVLEPYILSLDVQLRGSIAQSKVKGSSLTWLVSYLVG
ncbi:hypothetical protein OUZ56_014952 [Daphnia magna]|uniref:Uncharacterized protein n=1 Tax=Daphnia magna TaxID=35525 RepID=A0ABR0ALQ1_9CRUS|nr:hypothetical protein OUZ56_014952 [Daphnia magna]